MRQDKPLLSIGMIVKNEMRCLKKCLDALTPLREAIPCELVIADTGSTDGTRELAAQYADLLFDFEWCDDFSAARNAVLDRCSGVWHLQVDADEYLCSDFSRLTEFLRSKDSGRYEAAMITIRNYSSKDMENSEYMDFYAARLLRTASGVRFTGAIHEILNVTDHGRHLIGLYEIMLHHDGYAYQTAGEEKRKKERNLTLLAKELEQEPGSLRRIIQCLESSYTREQERKYIYMTAEALKTHREKHPSVGWTMAAYHRIVIEAGKLDLPELAEWIEAGRRAAPESLVFDLDSSWIYARHWNKLEKYEKCLSELERYDKALNRYDAGRFNNAELCLSPVYYASDNARQGAALLCAAANAKLQRWDEAKSALDKVRLAGSGDGSRAANFLAALLEMWKGSHEDISPILKRVWRELQDDTGRGAAQRRDQFIGECSKAFDDKASLEDRPCWQLFISLGGSCDLGRFALLMDAVDSAGAEKLLDDIERMDLIPPEALEHAVSLGAALPERFFRMKAEELSAQAAGLAKLLLDNPDKAVMLWGAKGDGGPGRALFGYNFACELAGNIDWEKNGSLPLFENFCDRAEEYVQMFFTPMVCTGENMHALPVLVRYALCCMNARKCLHSGDELNFVRNLRAGLAACPGMKKMVSYLTDKAKAMTDKPKATPEMMALASQIRAILANYPEWDPAVQMLKNSKEYKLVAHLIEG